MRMARYDPDRKGYRIFVGNLSGVTTHDDLAHLFHSCGPIVDVWLASNPPGFGFVVFKHAADAEKAVNEKNSTEYLSRVIKVQHARLFRDRPTRSAASGDSQGYSDSDASRSPRSRSPRSRSKSRSRTTSRSTSRSSRRWSRSSSRLNYFSRLYGTARRRSRSSSGSRSRSRSRSRERSKSSAKTCSEGESEKRSKSRLKSRSRSRSKTKSRFMSESTNISPQQQQVEPPTDRGSHRHRHRRGSSHHHHRHRHGHHRSRQPRRRQKRRHKRNPQSSHSSSQSGESSGPSRHSSPSRSPCRPKRSSSRPKSSSSRRGRQRDQGCRHCRHCKGHASSVTSNDSTSHASSSSASEGGASRKSRRHRRRWRRSKKSEKRSSSSSSSSSSSRSPLSPDRGKITTGNRDRSRDASEASRSKSQARAGSPSLRAEPGSKCDPKSQSDTHMQELVSSTVFIPNESGTTVTKGVSDSASDAHLVSAGNSTAVSGPSGGSLTATESKTNPDSKSVSETVSAAGITVTGGVSTLHSEGNQDRCGVGESVSKASAKAVGGQVMTGTRSLVSSVDRTQIRFSLTGKVPSFSFKVPSRVEKSKAEKETRNHNLQQSCKSKEKSRVNKEPDLHKLEDSGGSTAEEQRCTQQSEDTVKASQASQQQPSAAADNEVMDVSDADVIDISDVCSDLRMSPDLDDPENESEGTMSKTKKCEESHQRHAASLKNVTDALAMQTPATGGHDKRCTEKEHGGATKLDKKCTDGFKSTTHLSEESPDTIVREEALGVSPENCQDHNKGLKTSKSVRRSDQVNTPTHSSRQRAAETADKSNPEEQGNIDAKNSLHSSSKCKPSHGQAIPELSNESDESLENSEDKLKTSVHDTQEQVCPNDSLKQKNSSRRSASPRSSRLSAYHSRSVLSSSRQSASCTKEDDDQVWRKRKREENRHHHRDSDGGENPQHASVQPSQRVRHWKLKRKRDCNESEHSSSAVLESSRNGNSPEGTSDRCQSTLKEKLLSTNTSGENNLSHGKHEEDRGPNPASSHSSHERAHCNKEEKPRSSSQESPPAENQKRKRISAAGSSESSPDDGKLTARSRCDDRQSDDGQLFSNGDGGRLKMRNSFSSNLLVSLEDRLVHCKPSELNASKHEGKSILKTEQDETSSNTRQKESLRSCSRSPEDRNAHPTCTSGSSILWKIQGHVTASGLVCSSAPDETSKSPRETEKHRHNDSSVSPPTSKLCDPNASVEGAEGSKGRRALLPTPKPALLPIPSQLLHKTAATEHSVAPGSWPSPMTSPPQTMYRKFSNNGSADRAGRGSCQTSPGRASLNSSPRKRREADSQRDSSSPEQAWQNKHPTSEDAMMDQQRPEDSEQQKIHTYGEIQEQAKNYHIKNKFPRNDRVNSKQGPVERLSNDHRGNSDGDTEHPTTPRQRSKIFLIRKAWDPAHDSSHLPAVR